MHSDISTKIRAGVSIVSFFFFPDANIFSVTANEYNRYRPREKKKKKPAYLSQNIKVDLNNVMLFFLLNQKPEMYSFYKRSFW